MAQCNGANEANNTLNITVPLGPRPKNAAEIPCRLT